MLRRIVIVLLLASLSSAAASAASAAVAPRAKHVAGAFKVSATTTTTKYRGRSVVLLQDLFVENVRNVRIRLYCNKCRRFPGTAKKRRISSTTVKFTGLNWLLPRPRVVLVTGLRTGYVTRFQRLGVGPNAALVFRAAGCLDGRRRETPCPKGTKNPAIGSPVAKIPVTPPAQTPAHSFPATPTPTGDVVTPPFVRAPIPDTLLLAGPRNAVGPGGTTVQFAGDDPAATFECAIDGAAYSPCTSPVALQGLAEGQHRFEIRSRVGAQVDTTPLQVGFTVDLTAPDTSFTTVPSGETGPDVTVGYASNEGDLRFDCSSNGVNWSPCDGGSRVMVGLHPGHYDLFVRARDYAGNVDPSPIKATWTVTVPVTLYSCSDQVDGVAFSHPLTSGQTTSGSFWSKGTIVTGGMMRVNTAFSGGDDRVRIGLYDVPEDGQPLWETEVHAASNGYFTISPPLRIQMSRSYWIRATAIGDVVWYSSSAGCWIGQLDGKTDEW